MLIFSKHKLPVKSFAASAVEKLTTGVAESFISVDVHQQYESGLCWLYALVTCLKNSIYRLAVDLHKTNKISLKIMESVLEEIGHGNDNSEQNRRFHYFIRTEIIRHVIPRFPGLKNSDMGNVRTCQGSPVRAVIEKLAYPR